MEEKIKQQHVIGVDGGGTKTVAALANLRGKILELKKTGPSSFMKVGVRESVSNITKAIGKILKEKKEGKILSTFIGLAAIEENKEMKRIIMRNLRKQPKIKKIFRGKIIIDSDQIIGFRSGTDEKNGIVLISGTGTVAHGWRNKKEAHTSGWGWLADEGSAFWLGQKAYQAVFKNLDGRGKKTLMKNLFFQKLKVKDAGGLKKKILSGDNIIKTVASLSVLSDKASQKGDEVARNLFIEGGKELALSVNTVIRKLNFQKRKFPLVLIGGMFKSNIFLKTVKKEIKKFAPKTEFILSKKKPVIGAVKLAIENLK